MCGIIQYSHVFGHGRIQLTVVQHGNVKLVQNIIFCGKIHCVKTCFHVNNLNKVSTGI